MARDQVGRAFGAVAQHIGLGVFGKVGGKCGRIGDDPVDRGIGEPRHWHRAWIDLFGDRAPFTGDGIGERGIRQDERRTRGRPDRAPVEQDRAIGDRNVGPEPLHLELRSP